MLEHTNPAEQQEQHEPFETAGFLAGLTGAQNPPAQEKAAAQGLTVKYNGEVMTLSPEESVAFAQKGMNYDRLMAQRDAAASRAASLEREISLMQSGGDQPEEAERRRLERGWLAFLERYPEVRDPKSELPAEVWGEIRAGKEPAAAYLEFRNRQLERQVQMLKGSLAARAQTLRAAEKSPGSAGGAAPSQAAPDPFIEGLMQGF